MGYKALVIDDDESCREVVCRLLADRGLEVNAAQSGSDALHRLEQGPVDLVITDLRMPGLSGIDVIEAARRRCPRAEIVLMTGFATVESAVHAMKLGAFDYLQKPFPLPQLGDLVDRALARVRSRRAEPADPFLTPGPVTAGLFREAERLAGGDLPILICGEAGTGKKALGRAIHGLSPRAAAPIRTLRCAALSASLQEPELLRAGGLLDEVAGGTLLVAQAWAASPVVQREMVRLLDALDAATGWKEDAFGAAIVPPRLIVTTDRDLTTRARRGGFRPDLFERLALRTITIPPLRERRDEILPLAEGLLPRIADRIRRPTGGLSPDAAACVSGRPWPGNVTELLATLEQAALAARGTVITAADLAPIENGQVRSRQPDEDGGPARQRDREQIIEALRRNAYNLTLTYQQLGISRTTLWRKLKRYGITLTRAVDGTAS
jgi:DNA-binding NtrC family response regulator